MNALLDARRGGLVGSCQAYPGEPMLDPRTMAQVAQAAVAGGAVGIRGKGLDDLRAMREVVSVPIIGLVKVGDTGVYITPTLADCLEVAATGCEVVALDGTRRPRPDGLTLAETIVGLRAEYPEVLVMADCGSVDDAEAALAAGADILGTTLAGYTGERDTTDGPDWEVVDGMVALAAASGTPRELLVAMRDRIAVAVENPNTAARDLAALTKRLLEIVRDIEAIDARASQEADDDAAEVEDGEFDAASV